MQQRGAARDIAARPPLIRRARCSRCSASFSVVQRAESLSRRAAVTLPLCALFPALSARSAEEAPPPPVVTQRVYFDVGVCSSAPGSSIRGCTSTDPLGRLVIGLFGDVVPSTARAFVALCTQEGGYQGSLFSRVLPGEFVEGGVGVSLQLPPNDDIVRPEAFALKHRLPGTVSLALSDDSARASQRLRTAPATAFRITTGPGPQPSLDEVGIVVGRVVEGLDVLQAIAAQQTYAPPAGGVLLQYNSIASALGDKRAAIAKLAWSKPRDAIIITACGLLD